MVEIVFQIISENVWSLTVEFLGYWGEKPNNLGCATNTDWYFLNFKNSVLISNEFDNMTIISRIFQEAKFSYLVYILKIHKTKGNMLQTLIFLISNLFNSLRYWG